MSVAHQKLDPMDTTHANIIRFETQHPTHNGNKALLIRNTFGLSESRYYQILTNVMLDPTTLPEFPQEVNAWLRRRDAANRRTRDFAMTRRMAS